MYVNLNSKPVFLMHLFFFICAVIVFYFQNYITYMGFHNITFPDGSTLLKATQKFIGGERSIFEQRAAWLPPIIYSVPMYILGTYGVLIFNHLLMYSFYRVKIYDDVNIFFLLFFSLFYWLSSFLPNKEIPILFLTGLFIVNIYHERLFFALLVAIIAFLVRDGHGVFLILFILMLLIKFPIRLALILLFLVAFSIDSYLTEIADITHIFMLQRTAGIIENLRGEYLPYIIRIFGNITNLGSRSILYESNFFNILGFGYYLAGFGIFIAFLLSLYDLLIRYKKNKRFDNILAGFFMFSVLMFSVSPLVQSRYLIPIAFVYLTNSSTIRSSKKIFYYFLFFSVLFLMVLRIGYIFTIELPKIGSFYLDAKQIFYEGKLLEE